jgi:hypothetical protein
MIIELFRGVDERSLLCGYSSLTERFLARNGNGTTLSFGLQLP